MKRRSLWRARGAGSQAPERASLGEAGQALVEVAIALPILLALLVGIFEFARAYNIQQVITNAAREGAREGVVDTTNPTGVAVTRANARLSDASISGATVNASCAAPCDTGAEFTVDISVPYTFVFIGPVLSLFSSGVDPGTITLTTSATMRKE
jgi:Flp pilus assembly protein TadG